MEYDMKSVVQTGTRRYLTLALSEKVFAIDAYCVREILDSMELTTLPHFPDCMKGVINVHGAVASVVDLGFK